MKTRDIAERFCGIFNFYTGDPGVTDRDTPLAYNTRGTLIYSLTYKIMPVKIIATDSNKNTVS
jgi:hypothetical protein